VQIDFGGSITLIKTIEEQLLFSTLKVECINSQNQITCIGTSFLVQKQVAENAYKIYLVSNRHVLCAENSFQITFTVLKDDLSGPDIGNTFPVPITNVNKHIYTHPDKDIDIAAMDITGLFNMFPNRLFFQSIPYEMLATFDEDELNVAQNVMFVGYPDNRYDKKNNIPIIRSGLIASHPKYDYNGKKIFIIDGQVFPGSSGSPVIVNLTVESWKTGSITVGKNKIRLLGVVSSTMIRNNKLTVLNTSTAVGTQEVIGLGIVYKSTSLKEIIDAIS
jgi:hypothetical protein